MRTDDGTGCATFWSKARDHKRSGPESAYLSESEAGLRNQLQTLSHSRYVQETKCKNMESTTHSKVQIGIRYAKKKRTEKEYRKIKRITRPSTPPLPPTKPNDPNATHIKEN